MSDEKILQRMKSLLDAVNSANSSAELNGIRVSLIALLENTDKLSTIEELKKHKVQPHNQHAGMHTKPFLKTLLDNLISELEHTQDQGQDSSI